MNYGEDELSPPPTSQSMTLATGFVGWKESSEYHDLGDDSNDGHTLVRVTLNAGRHPSSQVTDGSPDGFRVLVQILGPLYYIPPQGTHVLVGFPNGNIEAPGSGYILGTINPNPAIQFKHDRAVLDVGEDMHLILKGKSVTLSDHEAPAQFLQVGTPYQGGTSGISACDSQGGGFTVQAGVVGIFASDGGGTAGTLVQITHTSFEVWQTDGSNLVLKGGDGTLFGTNVYCMGGGVYLGKVPTAANTALWGSTGSSGLPSSSVYISPT